MSPKIGTVIFADALRAEVRIIGVGKLGFAVQAGPRPLCHWASGEGWIVIREVKAQEEVDSLCRALGYEPIVGEQE